MMILVSRSDGGDTMERWRDIPGYEELYQISDFGNVRTCDGKTTYTKHHGFRRWKQRTIKQKKCKNAKGRVDARVDLWKNGQPKTWLVARLVGLAWCGGYGDGMTINHINGNHLDNRAENLEWVTRSENIQKGFADGLYKNSQHTICLICNDETLVFKSNADASRFLGRNIGYVSNSIKANRPITAADGKKYSIGVIAQ